MHEEVRNYVEELLANHPCPMETWIHLQSCPKCSRKLEALRKSSSVFSRDPFETPEPDSLFYARVQARIEFMRCQSPWRIFLDTNFAKRLVLACLACTGLLAAYLLNVSLEEYNTAVTSRTIKFTNPEADPQTLRDAVLVNFVVNSMPVNEPNR